MAERRRWRRDVVPAGQMARRHLRRIGQPPSVAALADVRRAWPRAAGSLGEGSTPIARSRAGVITIACGSAAQAQRLSDVADEILATLEATLDGEDVSDLRFVVSAAPAQPSAGPPPAPSQPRPRHHVAARHAARGVSDPVLRRLLERAAAASYARTDSPANSADMASSDQPG